jgi:hypothetical protein
MTQDRSENQLGQNSNTSQNKTGSDISNQQGLESQKNGKKNGLGAVLEEAAAPKFIDESIADPRVHLKEEPPIVPNTSKVPEPEFMKPGEGPGVVLTKILDEVIDPRKAESEHPPLNLIDDDELKQQKSQNLSTSGSTSPDINQQAGYFHQESAASLKGDSFRPDEPNQTSSNQSSSNQSQNQNLNTNARSKGRSHEQERAPISKPSVNSPETNKADFGSKNSNGNKKSEEIAKTDRNMPDMDNDTQSKYF